MNRRRFSSGLAPGAVLSWSARAQTEPVEVTIEVTGVRSDRGRLLVALHDNR